MIEIKATTELDTLRSLKTEYLENTTAPLDGMWLCGFLPLTKHFGVYEDSSCLGYCCVNDEDYLLQFYLCDNNMIDGTTLLANMIAGHHNRLPEIKGAYVSTAEPHFLSQCFDNLSSFKVQALMYQLNSDRQESVANAHSWALLPIESESLAKAVEFALDNLDSSKDWLNNYFSNLIQRRELFGCWLENELIATGECRIFDDVQQGYADLGVIVGQHQRGRGLATWVIHQLAQQAMDSGLEPICSTGPDNIHARKAITRVGFVSQHRIIRFST